MTGMIPIAEMETLRAKPGTAYGYARVSTAEQADSGDSIDGQRQRIYEYYLARLKPQGVAWGGHFVDPGVSAFKIDWQKRPAGRQLLSRLQRNDHVITDRVDRMCRSAPNMFNIIQFARDQEMRFHFLDANLDPTTPMGEMIIGVIAILSQLDSSLKSKRHKEMYSHRIRIGDRIRNSARKKKNGNGQQSVVNMSRSIFGLRMIQRDNRIDYHIHWRLWTACKLMVDNPEYREYARRSILWLDAKRAKKPFKVSMFDDEVLIGRSATMNILKRWARYIQPFLAIAPTLPFPPAPEKQDKDVLWASAMLNKQGKIKRWKFAYQPIYEDIYQYHFVEPRRVFGKVQQSHKDFYGSRTGTPQTEVRNESDAPSNKSSHTRRVPRRFVSARRAKGILHKKQERD